MQGRVSLKWLPGTIKFSDVSTYPMPTVCKMAGLAHEDCLNCPWPACILDLPPVPVGGGSRLSGMLSGSITKWREAIAEMPTGNGQKWLREKVKAWMFNAALPECRMMVQWPARYRRAEVDAARAFVATVAGR